MTESPSHSGGSNSNPASPAKTSHHGMSSQSPVTGIIDENLVLIDFGKHEGKTVHEVADLDKEFYERLAKEKDSGVFAIRRHRDKTFRLYINPLSDIDQ